MQLVSCFSAEKDLLEFLAEEIVAEKQAQKLKTIPAEIEGFKVSLNGADVTLIKEDKNEKYDAIAAHLISTSFVMIYKIF